MPQVPIIPTIEYNPSQIVENGWIRNTKDKPDYRYVLRLIKYGRLRARNVCLTGKKYFRVLGADIIRYNQSIYDMPSISEQPLTAI
jgi:hypothetical protein